MDAKLKIATDALSRITTVPRAEFNLTTVATIAQTALCDIDAIAPPVAAGSADTPEFRNILAVYGTTWNCTCPEVLISHINAWGAQQREAGKMEAIATLMYRINHHSERAEKAEAALAVEIERVQDYYTRWRCERENPTNTHRLDTWQAACGKARAERDKAEARVKELEEDAMRWRYLRDLDHDLTGTPGQPCVAIPDGASSGHYATGKDAVIAVDRAMGKSS